MTAIFSLSDLNTSIDREPRIRDLRLAEVLGFERPRKIRDLIERNKSEIEGFGSSAPRRGAYRGQEITEYFLNEPQALLLCMFSRTERAAAVRQALIEVFMAFRRGQLPATAAPTGETFATPGILCFGDNTLDIIEHNNRPWLKGEQIASALGFGEPARDIVGLYFRNQGEFTDAETALVTLDAEKSGILAVKKRGA